MTHKWWVDECENLFDEGINIPHAKLPNAAADCIMMESSLSVASISTKLLCSVRQIPNNIMNVDTW